MRQEQDPNDPYPDNRGSNGDQWSDSRSRDDQKANTSPTPRVLEFDEKDDNWRDPEILNDGQMRSERREDDVRENQNTNETNQ